MHTVVYAPLLLSGLVVVLSRTGVRRLPPRGAAWAISVAAAALAASTVGAVALLAFPLAARIPVIAAFGGWDPRSVAARTPVAIWLSTLAWAAVAVLAWRVARELVTLGREFADVTGAQSQLRRFGAGEVIVIDEAVPRAHAVSPTFTCRGRVLVTTAMLDLLDDPERAAVVAHERAHLRRRHGVFLAVMRLTAALNPLLAPMRGDLRFALERWADEDAAVVTHRSVMAAALAKVAIAMLHVPLPRPGPAMQLHSHAVTERIAALLEEPLRRSRLAWALLAVALFAAMSLLWAMHDTERFFEAARLWQRR